MVAKGQEYSLTGNSDPAQEHLSWEPLTANLHAAMPKPSRRCVRWLKGQDKRVTPILFWLAEPGRALALDFGLYQAKIERILNGQDRELRQRLTKLGFRGKWDGNSEIVIPDPVIAFVNQNTDPTGVWIWATHNRFELWSHAYQQAEVRRAQKDFHRQA